MNILLVNDDGVYSPGIRILKEILQEIGNPIIVAPLEERSTTGHTLTLDHTLRITQIEKDIYGCSGYPADCTLVGVRHIFKSLLNKKIDLIVSGINRGANLGQDIYYSGTVAAAREGSFHGIPSIAVSSCMDFRNLKNETEYYYTASNFIKNLVKSNIKDIISPLTLLNINVPWKPADELDGIEITKVGFRHYSEDIDERLDFRGRKYYWIGGTYSGFKEIDNTDCVAVAKSKISISPLRLVDYGDPTELLIEKVKNFVDKNF